MSDPVKKPAQDRPPLQFLALFLIATLIFVVVAMLVTKQALVYFMGEQTRAVDLQSPNREIDELKAQFKQELNSYDQIDRERDL